MVYFLEQRALARHGATFEQTRAIASIGLIIACADRDLSDVEVSTLCTALPNLANHMGVPVVPMDQAMIQFIGQRVHAQIKAEGEQAVFEAARAHLDKKTGAMAVVLAAKVAAADGEISGDEMVLLRPIAKQLGLADDQVNKLIAASLKGADGATLH